MAFMTIKVPDKIHNELKHLSVDRKKSMTDIVNKAIVRYLDMVKELEERKYGNIQH